MAEKETSAVAPNIHARMVAVMRDLGAIGKDKKNEQQGFKYRGIDDVYNAINPILAKHGVFMTAEIMSKTREERTNAKGTVLAFTCLRMRYNFCAEDGSMVCTEAEGEGMDSGDKSSNKAMAVAHKYALLQAFCIPTQDLDDPDAQIHAVTAKQPPATVTKPAETNYSGQYEDPDGQMQAWIDQQTKFLTNCETLADIQAWEESRADAMKRLHNKNLAAWGKLVAFKEARIRELTKGNKA